LAGLAQFGARQSNLRYTPRERPVMEQRLRCRLAAASRAAAAIRPAPFALFRPGLRIAISSLSSARRRRISRYLERRFSRMSMLVLAMAYPIYGTES